MNSTKRIAVSALLGAVTGLAGCAATPGATAPQPVLMAIVSKALPGVTIYDAATDRQICQAKMDVAPHEAAFSNDGGMLFVPVYSSVNIGQPGPDGHVINFMHTQDCSIGYSLDTDPVKRPHFAETGASGLVYVTAEQDQSILVVDPQKRSIIRKLPTGSRNTHFFALSGDERRIYTSNVSDRTLSVIDVAAGKLLATVDVGASNQRMTLSPDGRWFVTSLWQSKKVAFYRTSDNSLDFTVDIQGAPFVGRFSPDGKYLYDMGMEPDRQPAGIRVWKIDLATRQVVAQSSANLGTGTGGIQVNPANGLLYLTAYSGQVSVLDPATLALVRQFTAADTPDGIFFGKVR